MAKLNWKDIITRVANNLGIETITAYQKSTIKSLVKDTMIKIHGKAEDVNSKITYAIFDGKPMTQEPILSVVTDLGLGLSDGLDLGTYIYKFAYYSSIQGETELAFELSVTIVSSQQKVNMSNIPTLPHGVNSIRIYRTKSDSSFLYLLTEKTDNLTTYSDTKKDTDLTQLYSQPTRYADVSYIDYPEDFLALRQVIFYDKSYKEIFSVEANSEEHYDKLQLNDIEEAVTIRQIMDGSVDYDTTILPDSVSKTAIVYVGRDTLPPTLDFKNRFEGYIQISYVAVPEPAMTNLASNPEIIYAFYDAIVSGATYRYAKTLLVKSKTDAETQALVLLVRLSKAEFDESLKNYAGMTKRQADVHVMQIPSFLNDRSMEL